MLGSSTVRRHCSSALTPASGKLVGDSNTSLQSPENIRATPVRQHGRFADDRKVARSASPCPSSPEAAAKLIGAGRQTVYNWRQEHEGFRQAWDEAIDVCVEAVETKVFDLARNGDITACIFLLRSRRPEVYNPNLVIRRTMLQLALEKAKAEAGALLIEGQAVNGRPMIYPRPDLERAVTNGTDTALDSAAWIDAYLEHMELNAEDDDGPGSGAA
jgi:hypothetical protein